MSSTSLVRIAEATGYNRAQVELVKDTIAKGASDDELMLFLHLAQRTGLDPFSRQIYLIERRTNVNGQWVTNRQPQTGIDGLRLIADRTDRYAPGRAPTYTYDADGRLETATAYVKKFVRGEWHEVAATAHYGEYVQAKKDGTPTQMWADRPHIMLAKCAEALALRRAFPADLSGLYTSDEIRDESPAPVFVQRPQTPSALPPPAPPANPATGEVLEALPATLTVAGVVRDPEARYNNKGQLWITFTIGDVPLTARGADFPDLAYLEGGDVVEATYQPTTNRGKTVNLLTTIAGDRNADGLTAWAERST